MPEIVHNGRASADQLRAQLQRAVDGGLVSGPGGRRPTRETLRAFMVRWGLGIDCAAFGYRAMSAADAELRASGQQALSGPDRTTAQALGGGPQSLGAGQLGAGHRGRSARPERREHGRTVPARAAVPASRGTRIADANDLRVGDVITLAGNQTMPIGHVRVIDSVERRGSWVHYTAVESGGGPRSGPQRTHWRVPNGELSDATLQVSHDPGHTRYGRVPDHRPLTYWRRFPTGEPAAATGASPVNRSPALAPQPAPSGDARTQRPAIGRAPVARVEPGRVARPTVARFVTAADRRHADALIHNMIEGETDGAVQRFRGLQGYDQDDTAAAALELLGNPTAEMRTRLRVFGLASIWDAFSRDEWGPVLLREMAESLQGDSRRSTHAMAVRRAQIAQQQVAARRTQQQERERQLPNPVGSPPATRGGSDEHLAYLNQLLCLDVERLSRPRTEEAVRRLSQSLRAGAHNRLPAQQLDTLVTVAATLVRRLDHFAAEEERVRRAIEEYMRTAPRIEATRPSVRQELDAIRHAGPMGLIAMYSSLLSGHDIHTAIAAGQAAAPLDGLLGGASIARGGMSSMAATRGSRGSGLLLTGPRAAGAAVPRDPIQHGAPTRPSGAVGAPPPRPGGAPAPASGSRPGGGMGVPASPTAPPSGAGGPAGGGVSAHGPSAPPPGAAGAPGGPVAIPASPAPSPGASGGAGGGRLIIPPGRTLSGAEAAIATRLVAEGRTVEAVPESTVRTPDFLVDGVRTELKTISDITSRDPSGAVARRIMDGRGQAGHIIVDLRGQSGMTEELAGRAAARAYGADNRTGSRLQNIRLIGQDFDLSVPRR